jgi:hypothetical protein
MGRKAGALLWNRQHVTLTVGANNIDTGLTQLGKSFEADSPGEPILGISGVAPPPAGTLPASRVQVIPMAPLAAWDLITISEPYFDTTTGTVHVVITLGGQTPETVNVLFWDPHTVVGPGDADAYNTINPG